LEQIFNKFAYESGSEGESQVNNNVGTQNLPQDDEELITASKAAYKLTKPEIAITSEFISVFFIFLC